MQCSWAAIKKKDSYLQDISTASKPGAAPKRRSSAVAASILTAIYHMLKDGTMYKDLGRNHFDRRSTDQQKKRLVKRFAADLGYAVEIEAARRLCRVCGAASKGSLWHGLSK